MQQMQMQMQQMQNPKPQNGNKGPEAQPQNQQQGAQQQNMQMPNLQNMQNMINGMQNMQMPNMQLQANDPNSLMMNIVMTITQTMINGMMQYMQMRNPQNQQQMQQQNQQQMQQQQQQNQQEQQQMQQNQQQMQQQAPENEEEVPEIQQDDEEILQEQQNPQKQPEAPEQPMDEYDEIARQLREEKVRQIENNNEARKERFTAESDLWSLKFNNEEFVEKEKKANEIDAEINKLTEEQNKEKQQAEAEQKELDNAIDEVEKLAEEKQGTVDKARKDIENDAPDVKGAQWNDKDMIEVEKGLNGLDTTEGPENVQNAAKSFQDTYRAYSSKMIMDGNESITTADNLKMYDAAKKFVDATDPAKKENADLSPEMKEARKSAENLVNKMDDLTHEKLMDAAKREKAGPQSASGRKPGMKWFSDAELNRAIMSLENMRNEAGGKLDPAADKFQNDLMDLKENIRKDPKGMHIDNYLSVYDSAEKFMQESVNSGKTGKDMDTAKAVAGTVKNRLNDNGRIDKLRTIHEYQQNKELGKNKINELRERQKNLNRGKKIDGLENKIRDAKNRKDNIVKDEKYQELKKRKDNLEAKINDAGTREREGEKRVDELLNKEMINLQNQEKAKEERERRRRAEAKARREQARRNNKNVNSSSLKAPNVKVGAM